jgi:hypothetical protein
MICWENQSPIVVGLSANIPSFSVGRNQYLEDVDFQWGGFEVVTRKMEDRCLVSDKTPKASANFALALLG